MQLQDAQSKRLSEPATLERQIHRMLADERAQAFVSSFFFPWLELDKLGNADPDKKFFPDYDVSLRELRQVLLQRPNAFRTTITEKLLVYSSGGSVDPSRVTPETLIRARQILRSMPSNRWSALIAPIVRTNPTN